MQAHVTRAGGYTGVVQLAVSGLPSGVSATVSPAQLPAGASDATITLSAADGATRGDFAAKVIASGSGIAEAIALYTIKVSAQPAFSLTAAAGALTIARGGADSARVAVSRTDFDGAIDFAVEGLPAGASATIRTALDGGESAIVVVAVDATVAPGDYSLTVKGKAAGLADRAASIVLTVPTPSFTLTPLPNALHVAAGSATTTQIGIGRSGFAGVVTLSLQTPPAGVSANFAPAGAAGDASTLTLQVAATVAPGTYRLTIRGAAAGMVDRVASLDLTVEPAASAILLAVNPAAVTIASGASGHATVSVERTNVAGNITFSASGVPAGITVTFTPPTTAGSASDVTIAVAPGASLGTHAILIEATAPGGVHAWATLTVTVVPAT